MRQNLSPPVLVFDGLDLSIYPTIESICADLEGIDVENGVYKVFDSMGRVIRLTTAGVKQGRWVVNIGTIVAADVETTPTGATYLYGLLRDHLSAIGRTVPSQAILSDLVAMCVSEHEHRK
jgi:hypothetical protein